MALTRVRPAMPHLNALRAFEAAARLGGFAAAADELCVTPGAVSQHIKALEEWAGAPLFQRRSQGVMLTALGRHVASDFRTAFDRVGEAVLALRSSATPETIQIATLPSIAQLWLLPRLPEVRRTVPEAVISVTAMDRPPNLRREPFDLALFYGNGSSSEGTLSIVEETIFPVCAPSLALRLEKPEDLAGETFLHDALWSNDWDVWLASAAPGLNLDTSGPVFSLFSLAIEEAKNGAGILIGHDPLVSRHLASGELVEPFRHRLKSTRSLQITYASSGDEAPILHRVKDALAAAQ